jgi:hypothetical protein
MIQFCRLLLLRIQYKIFLRCKPGTVVLISEVLGFYRVRLFDNEQLQDIPIGTTAMLTSQPHEVEFLSRDYISYARASVLNLSTGCVEWWLFGWPRARPIPRHARPPVAILNFTSNSNTVTTAAMRKMWNILSLDSRQKSV